MCSRYFISAGREGGIADVHPADQGETWIFNGNGHLMHACMRWGFPPGRGRGLVFNARAESAAQKEMFAESLAYRRCVVPALGFYEWNQAKERAVFREPSGGMLYFAGFYQKIKGEMHFVILTTKANASVARIHDRMPLILNRTETDVWLEPGAGYEPLLKLVPPGLHCHLEYEQQRFGFL